MLENCEDGSHVIYPSDPLDPAGSSCKCGAVSLIGVAANVHKDGHKTMLAYIFEESER